MPPGSVELHVGLVEADHVRGVARLDAGRELGHRLLAGHRGVLHFRVLEARGLRELVDLLLLKLVGEGGEVRQVPEHELLGALGLAPAHPPPRPRRRHAGRAGELQDIASMHSVHTTSSRRQPLTAPSVRPLTTQRWKMRYTTSGGSALRNAAPIMGPQKKTSSTMNSVRPVVMVRTSTLLTNTLA